MNLAVLAARRCGMPEHAVQSRADKVLQFMKSTVKTVHGVSTESYQGTPFEPLFATGQQGSGASPAAWLTIVVILMHTLDRLMPDRKYFDKVLSQPYLPDGRLCRWQVSWFRGLGGSVLYRNDRKTHPYRTDMEKLLSHSGGGSLNLKKCMVLYHVLGMEGRSSISSSPY